MWLFGLNPPPKAFAHISNNGELLYVLDVRTLVKHKPRQSPTEKTNLPENVSFVISVDSFDEKTKTMWATIASVSPEFNPIGENEEEKQKQEKKFRELEGQEIWIQLCSTENPS